MLELLKRPNPREDGAALWEGVTKVAFLTVNEKRAVTGYGAVQGGDTFA